MLWKDWCWSSNTLTTWCKELIHWKRPWCWERLKAGGEGDIRGWDGWMASLTWAWVWVSSKRWSWTGKPLMLQPMESERVRHSWVTELKLLFYWAFLVAQMVQNPPTMRKIWVESLGWKHLLEKEMATPSSILTWRIPVGRGSWWATVHGVTESDMTEQLSTHTSFYLSPSIFIKPSEIGDFHFPYDGLSFDSQQLLTIVNQPNKLGESFLTHQTASLIPNL